jgi:vWA-MoxR associated protein C-terminal domain/vWA-MoxR associated protein middle region (VMAP-M) 1
VNRSYKITQQQIQLRDLETELEALEIDSKRLANDLTYNKGEVEIGRLKREQSGLFKRSQEVGEQCDQLQEDIWQELITPKLNAFYKIASTIELIDQDVVSRAYRSSLKELSHRPIPSTLKSLILQIASFPEAEDEQQPLYRLVNALIYDQRLDDEYKNKLKNWAVEYQAKVTASSTSKQNVPEICLMIKVVNLPPSKYMVSAAIVHNPDLWRIDEVLLESTQVKLPLAFSSGCTKDQLPSILCELFATCGKEIALSNLTVHWFLPIELMSLDVEHWLIPIGQQQQSNGKLCKSVMVRCADRHFFSAYQVVNGEWQEKWKRIAPSAHCHKVLDSLNPMAKKTNISSQQADKVGCHFIEHQDPEQQEVFWDQLIGQGLPIAIWSRQSNATKRKAQGVIKSVTDCDVADLPTSLAKHRQTIPSPTSTNQAVAVHLSLLWDNPFLRFPSLDYRSD